MARRSARLQGETNPDCRLPLVGALLKTTVRRVRQILHPSHPSTEYPQHLHPPYTVSATCPHDVDAAGAGPPVRSRPVSQSPIYDQLRGERINADVPAAEAEHQRVDHPGKHRLSADGPGPAAVFGRSPGAGADLAAGWGWFTAVEPAVQAPLPPAAHGRQKQAQPDSAPPAPEIGQNPARHAAPDGRGAHPGEGFGPRQVDHTEPRSAAPV